MRHRFPVEALTVYDLPLPKIRLGRDEDGGYVVFDGLEHDLFLSCGVGRDTSFEAAFVDRYGLACRAHDGFVDALPAPHPGITFVRKRISGRETEHETNLHELIGTHRNVFLKMDIEGAEYEWLDGLSDELLARIRQVVIELHQPFVPERWRCLERLVESHLLGHLHGNNFAGTTNTEQLFAEGLDVWVGPSDQPTRVIDLDIAPAPTTRVFIAPHPCPDTFDLALDDVARTLTVTRTDRVEGWGYPHSACLADPLPAGRAAAVVLPKVLECTWLRRADFAGPPGRNTGPLPGPLDRPNDPTRPDIRLEGHPYGA